MDEHDRAEQEPAGETQDRAEGDGADEEPDRWAQLYASSVESIVSLDLAATKGIPAATLRRKAAREKWPLLQRGRWALPTPRTSMDCG